MHYFIRLYYTGHGHLFHSQHDNKFIITTWKYTTQDKFTVIIVVVQTQTTVQNKWDTRTSQETRAVEQQETRQQGVHKCIKEFKKWLRKYAVQDIANGYILEKLCITQAWYGENLKIDAQPSPVSETCEHKCRDSVMCADDTVMAERGRRQV